MHGVAKRDTDSDSDDLHQRTQPMLSRVSGNHMPRQPEHRLAPPILPLCGRPPKGVKKTWERPGVFLRRSRPQTAMVKYQDAVG